VTSATIAPSSGTISNGGTAVITLKLSEAVTVSGGTPVLDLNDGGTAIYAGGAGTTSLTFDYVVGSETAADLRITGIENAATVVDSAGNASSSRLSFDLKLGVNADFWKTGKSGNFAAGSNWTLNAPPAPGQEAVIGVAGTYTVSVTSAAAVAAIGIGNKGATLSIASGATFSAASGTGIDANLGAVVVIAARPSRPAVSSQIPALSLPRAAASSSAAAPLAIPQRARSQRPAAGSLN